VSDNIKGKFLAKCRPHIPFAKNIWTPLRTLPEEVDL
jgi:hypothetical protein